MANTVLDVLLKSLSDTDAKTRGRRASPPPPLHGPETGSSVPRHAGWPIVSRFGSKTVLGSPRSPVYSAALGSNKNYLNLIIKKSKFTELSVIFYFVFKSKINVRCSISLKNMMAEDYLILFMT